MLNNRFVRLGKNCIIDKNALIGYMPSRNIGELYLNIGDNARIRSGSVIYLGSRIGNDFETGHNVIVREENEIGNEVKIWSNSVIDYGCKIGNSVKIHCNCYIAQLTIIEDDVFIAPGVMVANEKYPTGRFDPKRIKGPRIKKGSRIGIGSIIMPGITIGENCIIGAGAVVTKDVPPNSIAYGVPARVVENIDSLLKRNDISLE
ncbi:MAG TPA: DapH/DapD/GlmU-related protein [Geobacterales bacterium]|nr:DapH/DapD/GlmU-related protein [Geobacterales bacterium]